MEKWKAKTSSHFSTPPTAAEHVLSPTRYANNRTGTKHRAGHEQENRQWQNPREKTRHIGTAIECTAISGHVPFLRTVLDPIRIQGISNMNRLLQIARLITWKEKWNWAFSASKTHSMLKLKLVA
jgi:hypothetical protein